ncbi:hypothetical protein GCK72_014096 [Caenorhabditis remanei]|uniref:J domain-containing protein n=1 Tax=Caenorhabditis remanei TaxID=31234 RepID=A0A6A5GQG7_CAERE|nr:hypothetical protein GCK72_014096 [Caenorhabditis remanei]KAF1757640.1 hypothetical protein GCK72_014096 [Caenorhabditis remanei]
MRSAIGVPIIVAFLFFVQGCESVGFAPELYCGLENCYDVLQIQREEFDKQKLAKAYRALARQYHPDRVKNKYYRLRVAPKVDVRIVIVGTILVISLFQFLSAKHKFSEAIEYATGVGKFRNMAIKDGIDRGLLEMDKNGKLKKIKGVDNDSVIKQIIIENLDVTGGYKKESVYDTLAWHTIIFPLTIFRYLKWTAQWYWRFSVKKEELDEEAKFYLIRKYLGVSQLEFDQRFTDVNIDDLFEKECWIKANCEKWKAEKEAAEQEKMAQSGRYKRYKRYMKNAGTISFVDEE